MLKAMDEIEEALKGWKECLVSEIELASLISRNPVAHKWKATYRAIVVRELILWRFHDLFEQAIELHKSKKILGARILLRSSFETLALLIYLNKKMAAVVDGSCTFDDFCNVTCKAMLGSRIDGAGHQSVNVLTALGHADKKYEGLLKSYEMLSESAHPSFDGLCIGYSQSDEENYTTSFSNNWEKLYSSGFEPLANFCIVVFQHEYNEEWPRLFEALESWIEENDEKLNTVQNGI